MKGEGQLHNLCSPRHEKIVASGVGLLHDNEISEQLLRVSNKLRDAENQLMEQCQKLVNQSQKIAQRLAEIRRQREKSN